MSGRLGPLPRRSTHGQVGLESRHRERGPLDRAYGLACIEEVPEVGDVHALILSRCGTPWRSLTLDPICDCPTTLLGTRGARMRGFVACVPRVQGCKRTGNRGQRTFNRGLQWKSLDIVANFPSSGVKSSNLPAIKLQTSPSRCQVPCTASSLDPSSSRRCVSRRERQTMTCTTPVSSSRLTKIVPPAVSGCCRNVTMPQYDTRAPSRAP